MFGPTAEVTTLDPTAGVVLRVCTELLEGKDQLAKIGINISFTAQFIEIYNEKVTDLLTGNDATLRRDNGEVVGALEQSFSSNEEFCELLSVGHARKRFAATAMNDRSSRSHSALVIQAVQSFPSKDLVIKSQLHLVDLAGSERVKKSNVQGTHLKEAVGINSSLLGNFSFTCIS